MAPTPVELIGPSLEKIYNAAAGRKYVKLRQDTKDLIGKLDQLFPNNSSQQIAITAGTAAQAASPVAKQHNGDSQGQPDSNTDGPDGASNRQQQSQDSNGAPASATLAADAVQPGVTPKRGPMPVTAAQAVLDLLRQAIETRKPQLVELSLDCIQKLIAHKQLQGAVLSINHRREQPGKGGRRVADEDEEGEISSTDTQTPQAQALELLCRCDDIPDEGVELQVLKGLLTAVTSTTILVHNQALLLAVRTCYNIFLMTRSEVNQTTAKASLTQMLNVVFQRMEAGSSTVVVAPIIVSDMLGLPNADASTLSAFVQSFLLEVVSSVDPFATSYVEDIQEGLDNAFVHENGADSGDESEDISGKTTSRAISAGSFAPSASEATQPDPAQPSPGMDLEPSKEEDIATTLRKDAFLVFRALCKLSTRTADSNMGSDVTVIRGKVLALELLKVLLENAGPVFHHSDKFASAIKQYLCYSLLKNASSLVPQVMRLTCSIFLTLLNKFRQQLKAEISVFFPMIFLRAIEPPAPHQAPAPGGGPPQPPPAVDLAHRSVVMKCLLSLCEDGQLLVDLFVNYDCDLEGSNLFERMVTALVRIAQAVPTADPGTQQYIDEDNLRFEALKCSVAILKSLLDWYSHQSGQQDNVVAAVETKLPDGPSVLDLSGEASTQAVSNENSSNDIDQQNHSQDSDTHDAQKLETFKATKKVYQEGIQLFNKKPKKGVAYMQEQGVLGRLAEDVAKFLQKTQGLDKTMIGEYLGEREEMCLAVMHCYVDAMDFNNADFDAAIRKFLAGFRLPGEAQKIDRLMEKFAERYVKCNAESFKSADVAYVLAYSVIMLNTDAHNPMVKVKMSKQDFLRNNRGINDGGDLPEEYMSALYDRIVTNEIKMKDNPMDGVAVQSAKQGSQGWLDTVMNLIPGRKQQASMEPSEDAVRRTHDFLREKAKGATFFAATDSDTIRPMLDVAWAPMLGAFSVLFEEYEDPQVTTLCLTGFVTAIRLTSLMGMGMFRNTYVTSLARFTMLHAPANMRMKNARAFRALLLVAEISGNHLHDNWLEVLRCVSRFELLQQLHSGMPGDAFLFAPDKEELQDKGKRKGILKLSKGSNGKPDGEPLPPALGEPGFYLQPRGKGKEQDNFPAPPPDVLAEIDAQELNRLFVQSDRLDSEAIVEFVRTLCQVAQEELKSLQYPRVYSLTKIVEIAHFNMSRIRLVWSRIWAVLSDFFVEVGCHKNLQVAMYSVDSLRQLAMKFLERDELSNYTFQNDFLKPFVVVMRQSKSVEIRDLIIRSVSQMVLARVSNIQSGWKSMFMVFTTAANDESPNIVRLAFDTIEKIVRQHFNHITETETTIFTDCVNCLIAFTNNPHSLDVSLNAIAFLGFCATKLAEGDIGDVEELPEGVSGEMQVNRYQLRIKASRGEEVLEVAARGAAESSAADASSTGRGEGDDTPQSPTSLRGGIRFTDKDEHMYFWFPLLAGLSELTFDPRPDIRKAALSVLFFTLKEHGQSFEQKFWIRIFDSVLLPIFDHVRAEVTDTTTFTDDKRRAEVDSWLYDTAKQCLQNMVDVVIQFYSVISMMLPRILDLLLGFVRRTHQSLAAVGVAALARLVNGAGLHFTDGVWMEAMGTMDKAVADTLPDILGLVNREAEAQEEPSSPVFESPRAPSTASGQDGASDRTWSLAQGAGSRRLAEVRCRASVQLLLVQAFGEVYTQQNRRLSGQALVHMLNTLEVVASHARDINSDFNLRQLLLMTQLNDMVPEERMLPDPPLLKLEVEATTAYLSMLQHLNALASLDVKALCKVEERLVQLCIRNLQRFESGGMAHSQSGHAESGALAPLMVATLRVIGTFDNKQFKHYLKEFFPLLTNLISCEHAPPQVTKALSDLFTQRIGPLVASNSGMALS